MKRSKRVTKFTTKIPDVPDRKLYVESPELVTTKEGKTIWGIDLRKEYGENYLEEIPTMTDAEWMAILDLVLGFVDFDEALYAANATAQARKDKRDAARYKEKKCASSMSYNVAEQHVRALNEKRKAYKENCCVHADLIREAFSKMSLGKK